MYDTYVLEFYKTYFKCITIDQNGIRTGDYIVYEYPITRERLDVILKSLKFEFVDGGYEFVYTRREKDIRTDTWTRWMSVGIETRNRNSNFIILWRNGTTPTQFPLIMDRVQMIHFWNTFREFYNAVKFSDGSILVTKDGIS